MTYAGMLDKRDFLAEIVSVYFFYFLWKKINNKMATRLFAPPKASSEIKSRERLFYFDWLHFGVSNTFMDQIPL